MTPIFAPDPAWLKASEEDRAKEMQRRIDALTPDDLKAMAVNFQVERWYSPELPHFSTRRRVVDSERDLILHFAGAKDRGMQQLAILHWAGRKIGMAMVDPTRVGPNIKPLPEDFDTEAGRQRVYRRLLDGEVYSKFGTYLRYEEEWAYEFVSADEKLFGVLVAIQGLITIGGLAWTPPPKPPNTFPDDVKETARPLMAVSVEYRGRTFVREDFGI